MCVCSLLSWCFSNLPVESRAKQQSCHRSEPGQLRGVHQSLLPVVFTRESYGFWCQLKKNTTRIPWESPGEFSHLQCNPWWLDHTTSPRHPTPKIKQTFHQQREFGIVRVHFCAISQFQKVVGTTPLNLDTSPKITQLKPRIFHNLSSCAFVDCFT